MRKVTMDGAVMRNKLRGQLANQIARMSLSTEGQSVDDSREALDALILRAREINATLAAGEVA